MSNDEWLSVADKFGVVGVNEMHATPADIENMCRAIASARGEAERLSKRVSYLERALKKIEHYAGQEPQHIFAIRQIARVALRDGSND